MISLHFDIAASDVEPGTVLFSITLDGTNKMTIR